MSGASQIHIFVGAPIIPTLLKKPKEDRSSTDTFEKWKKLYLSFTKDTSLLCAKKDRCPDHADHQMPKSEALTACFKDEFTPNFGGKSEIANLTDCAVYSQSIKSFSNTNEIGESTGIICHVSGDVNSTKNQMNHLIYKDLFNPVKINEQQSKQSEDNEEDINSMKRNDFDISLLAPSTSRNINKMKSAEQDDNPPAFQCDHCQPLGQYVKTSCPQKMDKSKMDKPLHLCTCLGISTDTEYHSILTSSQAALLSGRHAVEQNSIPIKPAQEQGVKMYESCRDLETVLDPFIQINENGSVYPDLDELNCRHTYESSLELFDSNSPEKENLIFEETHFQENVGLSTHHSPDNKPNNELCYTEQSKTETLCFQRDLSAKRPRTFEDISPAIHFRSGNEKRSKKAMSAYSSICPVPQVKEQNILRSKTVQKYSSLLKECISKGQKYTVLVTVLHPCHVKEIKIKSGTKLPSRVPLATVVVFDQSEIQRKVVLWRAAAFWSLTVFPGDIILLTDVILYENSWTGETMLQSTFTTQLLNLGSCSNIHPNKFSHIVAVNILQDLLTYVSSKHAYLETLPQRKRQTLNNIQHVLLDELRPDVLVHSVLKIVDLTVLTESTYSFKGETQRKIVLTVEQIKDQNYTLVLWGALTALYPQLQRKRDHIWEFKYLFTKHNPVSGELELHTTPWSTLECLFDDDQRAVKFKEKFEKDLRLFTCVTTLATHLEEKCSGVIQVKVHISELKFTVASSPHEIVFDASVSLQYIVTSLALITYVGCAKCGRELQADENKIYKQCNQCLPSNKVKTFYRAFLRYHLWHDCSRFMPCTSYRHKSNLSFDNQKPFYPG
ncbi:shieldin complex subunit 2 isoform X2 [Anolis carolinensis]|uniref:shieldin complex subunit 2 isoform X2 n=1 Tax=Anolis carolinensis TaxID=28377 RepID=UPI002F2B67F9